MDPAVQPSGIAPTSRASRLGTWLALVAFLLGWSAPQWHFAESVHNWCATHQALEHASPEHHGDASLPEAAAGSLARSAAPRAVGTSESLDEHSAACSLALAKRPTTRVATGAPALASLDPTAARPLPIARTTPARGVALLREAPKTSPPALS